MASAAFTLGSVGDVITLCRLILKGIDAVSHSRGSAVQYQRLRTEIWNLSRALMCVQSLLERNPQLPSRGDLEKIVSDCYGCLNRFLKRIEVFDCLGPHGEARRSVKVLYKKLRWLSVHVRWNSVRMAKERS